MRTSALGAARFFSTPAWSVSIQSANKPRNGTAPSFRKASMVASSTRTRSLIRCSLLLKATAGLLKATSGSATQSSGASPHGPGGQYFLDADDAPHRLGQQLSLLRGQAGNLQIHDQMGATIGDMPAERQQLEPRQLLDHAGDDPDFGQAQQREAKDRFGGLCPVGGRSRGSAIVGVGRHGIRTPKGGNGCESTAPGVVATPGQ